MGFVHLHSHTSYSIKDAVNKIPEYVSRVKELGMNAAAITDHGVMYGVIEFYHQCEKQGIKPILGCEVYVAPVTIHDKNPHDRYDHLVLLAENEKGFYNIQQICTAGFGDGFYYKPRVDDDILRKYSEGIICLSACMVGRVQKLILKDKYEDAKQCALYYQDIFGKGNYFLELQDHGLPEQKIINAGLMRISNETGIEMVVTNDCHYTLKEDAKAHDVILCMQQEKKFNEPNRNRDELGTWYVKSEQEMRELFPYALEAVENTQKIADRCNVTIKFHETKMPDYPVPEGYDAWTYLNKLCEDGFNKKYASYSQEAKNSIRKQIDYQLGVIKQMGYIEYFLIVQDYCRWARNNGVLCGPGRGSAAGSYVTYCLDITDIEPGQFDLQFERFLNPARVSMPDVDSDFNPKGRGKVISHVKEVYGQNNVCQIITFMTMAAKEAIKDTGKVFEYQYSLCDKISKMIPNEPKMTIKKALEQNPELKELYDQDSEVKFLIDMSMKMEGLPKATSTHAAGVIISGRPVNEYIPLAKTPDSDDWVSQFNMVEVEELGLLKMDFLGLRTLDVEGDAIANIQKNSGVNIKLEDIPLNDPEVYKHISTGQTNGMFQLESKGMQGFMTKLKPECIEDLIAGVSLYRPGPMDYIPQYIEGKNNQDKVVYDCPQLEPILKNTYGCIVYQEQVTRIVRDLAGYSMGDADNIRRAMSKKKDYVINAERQSFVYGDEKRGIPGCIKNGIKEEIANRIYDHMVDFAKYAFNKSHAACYAIISYQTAYLMHYFPTEYWAAIMTSVINNAKKLAAYIQAARAQGVKISNPDINLSQDVFVAKDNAIRYALCGVKGISPVVAAKIVSERELNGPFVEFSDTIKRLISAGVDKAGIGRLIDVGAFDCFGKKRSQLSAVYLDVFESNKKSKKDEIAGQINLFDFMNSSSDKPVEKVSFPDIPEKSFLDILMAEKDATGIYLSGHPLEGYDRYIKKYANTFASDLEPDEDTGRYSYDRYKTPHMVAMITEIRKISDKNGNTMAFLTLEDMTGQFSAVMFSRVYSEEGRYLTIDDKVYVSGKISIDEEKGVSLLIDHIELLDTMKANLFVRFMNTDDYNKHQPELSQYRVGTGRDNLVIYIADIKKTIKMDLACTATDEFVTGMQKLYGQDNVVLKV